VAVRGEYLKVDICPICKKSFVKAPMNIYKLLINGKTVHYDKYSCLIKAQEELDKKRTTKKINRRGGL
jgi:hypothetical protein